MIFLYSRLFTHPRNNPTDSPRWMGIESRVRWLKIIIIRRSQQKHAPRISQIGFIIIFNGKSGEVCGWVVFASRPTWPTFRISGNESGGNKRNASVWRHSPPLMTCRNFSFPRQNYFVLIFAFWASGAIAFCATRFLIYEMLPQQRELSKLHTCTSAEGGNRCFMLLVAVIISRLFPLYGA